MYSIEFQRERGILDDLALCLAVEDTIFKYVSLQLSEDRKRASFRDIQQGILGLHIARYETKDHHGIIEYKEFITPGRYIAQVELQGFDEKGNLFRLVKEELESLKEKSPQELKKVSMQN